MCVCTHTFLCVCEGGWVLQCSGEGIDYVGERDSHTHTCGGDVCVSVWAEGGPGQIAARLAAAQLDHQNTPKLTVSPFPGWSCWSWSFLVLA